MAAAKTLAIPELLEQVLSNLPCIDILLDQRVSKLWKTTIAKSAFIQTALFAHQPSVQGWLPSAIAAANTQATTRGHHALNAECPGVGLRCLRFDPDLTAPQVSAALAGVPRQEVLLNPFLHDLCTYPDDLSYKGMQHFYAPNHATENSQLVRKLSLLQPAAKKVRIVREFYCRRAGFQWPARGVVNAADGQAVTLGDVFGFLDKEWRFARKVKRRADGIVFLVEAVLE